MASPIERGERKTIAREPVYKVLMEVISIDIERCIEVATVTDFVAFCKRNSFRVV